MILGAKAPDYDTWDCSMLRVAGIGLLNLVSDPGGGRQMDMLGKSAWLVARGNK